MKKPMLSLFVAIVVVAFAPESRAALLTLKMSGSQCTTIKSQALHECIMSVPADFFNNGTKMLSLYAAPTCYKPGFSMFGTMYGYTTSGKWHQFTELVRISWEGAGNNGVLYTIPTVAGGGSWKYFILSIPSNQNKSCLESITLYKF